MADFDSVIHLNVARERAQRRKQLKVGNTGTSGYRAPEVRSGRVAHGSLLYTVLMYMTANVLVVYSTHISLLNHL